MDSGTGGVASDPDSHAESMSVPLGDFHRACRSAVHLFQELAEVL